LGLQLAGIPFVAALGYSAALVVAVAVAVAITLLPALLGFAGPRVLARSHRRAAERAAEAVASGEAIEVPDNHSGWVRWAGWVAHHPWRSAIAATAALLVLSVPVLDMH